MAYVIGSKDGKKIAEDLGVGATYEASDGSVWTKQPDGSVSVKTSKGETFNNAYTPTSSNSSKGSTSRANTPYTGSSNSVITYNNTQQGIKDQMNANSMAWYDADETEKKRLEQENQKLGALLGGTVVYDPKTGLWSGNAEGIATPEFTWDEARPTAPPTDPRIAKLLNQILNRENFSYNVEDDPLYQQYAQMYQREGDRAMRDTLAEVAGGAGGMNSYAVTAAQQAANYYNSQLNDKIPELYQLAYQMYLQDIDNQVRDLGLLQEMDATQYNRYRDTMSDWVNDRNFAYGMYQDDVAQNNWQTEFDYSAMIDNRDFNYNDYWNNKEWDANQAQLDRENNRTDRKDAEEQVWNYISMGVTPDPEIVEQAGMNPETVNAAVAEVQKANLRASSKSSSSSSSSSNSQVKNAQDLVKWMANEGVMPSAELIAQSGMNPDDVEAMAVANGYEPTGEGKGDETFELRGVADLGLGTISDELLLQLIEAKLVIVDSDYNVSWADGVNASNYLPKLNVRS